MIPRIGYTFEPNRWRSSMRRRALGILVVAFGVLVLGAVDDEDDAQEYVAELDETRELIVELKLDEAEDALKAAKKELGKKKREKGVKAALEDMDANLEALEAFLDARKYVEKGKADKAFKKMVKDVMRAPCDLLFVKEAEALYADLKGKIYYVINDFESEAGRGEGMIRTSQAGAEAAVKNDYRMARDGRHFLEVKFAERPEGISERDQGAVRGLILEPPEGFSRELDSLKALSISILSPRKQAGRMDLLVTGGSNTSYAIYPGLTLDEVRWKDYVIPKERFRLQGDFMWRDGRRIQLMTRGPKAMEFMIDDVKFIR
jgi:hypothetical protein